MNISSRIEQLERKLDPPGNDVRAEIDAFASLLADPATRAALILEAERRAGATDG